MVLIPIEISSFIDGDTVKFVRNHQILTSRARWIDCPEVDTEWGIKAKQFVESLAENNQLLIEEYGPDRYDRIEADWFIGSRSLNIQVELILQGLAYCVPPTVQYNLSKRSSALLCKLIKSQTKAFHEKVGIWGDSNFILPNKRGMF